MSNEKPILFKNEMIRAILDGRKTQTRRVVKADYHTMAERDDGSPWPWRENLDDGGDTWYPCPYGEPGDRLWVRETWAVRPLHDDLPPRDIPQRDKVYYAATPELELLNCEKYRSAIHMPRWASRITLEITDVRVERLQDISEADAKAEGTYGPGASIFRSHVAEFRELWTSIYGPDSWQANPWLWVIEFKRIEQEIKAA